MIRAILEKETLDADDIAILMKNIRLLSHKDLVRLGLATETVEEDIAILETVEEDLKFTGVEVVAPKKRGKKV
jgi:hypothetical protein